MSKKFLLTIILIFAFTACGVPSLQEPPLATETPLTSHPVPETSPTPQPSPTAIGPTWAETRLIDSPFETAFPNETEEYQRKEIYDSTTALNADTRWVIGIRVDKLVSQVGEASTGIVLQGHTESGNVQSIYLVYQDGSWKILYQPIESDSRFTYRQVFSNLRAANQNFELTITPDGRNITLTNDKGFKFQDDPGITIFDGAQIVSASVQIGPQTKITLTKLAIAQLQMAEQTTVSSLPADFQTPTPMAAGNGEPEYVFHVAVNGDDTNPGSADKPFASIGHARNVIRTINQNMQGSIVVLIHDGTYPIDQPVIFTQEDSGQNGYDIVYRAAEGETPLLSGGMQVANWEKVSDGPLWKATPKDVENFRQLYVNGVRAQRAVSSKTVTGIGWAKGDFSDRDGILITSSSLQKIARPQDLELHWIYDWKDMRLPVGGMETNPDGTKTIWMKQPYFSHALWMGTGNGNTHQWYPKYEIPFYVENAPELLDEPGEWYFNSETRELFYLPRDGEDMTTADVVVPQAQTLIEIKGGMVGQEVHNLAFDGLSFAYAGWTRASERGTFGWQAQDLLSRIGDWGETSQEMTPAHVNVNSAYDIRFERCRFEHLGAVGLDLGNNVSSVTVQGNLFRDISDGAIVIGHWNHVYITTPSIQVAAHDNRIANNLISDVGVEYWGAPAITAYYVNNIQIDHNEISNIPYTGVSVGWGWSSVPDSTTSHDNLVANNLITDLMQRARDGGGIYTLGQQPGTMLEGNVVRRMNGDYGCYYTDEGSAFITLQNNVCDTAPEWLDVWINTIHDNHILNTYTNVYNMRNNGVNVQIANTVYISDQSWTPEAQAIIDNAGLEPAYSYLHDWLGR